MLHNILPCKFDITYKQNKQPRSDDFIFFIKNDKIAIKKEKNEFYLPKFSDYKGNIKINPIYLFSIDKNDFYLANETSADISFQQKNIFEFKEMSPQWLAFACITANQIARFYSGNKYCGCCGKELEKSKKERALVCPNCNNIVYPKISPAIIVAIVDNDKILMTKYANSYYKKYALIAGYCEIGESLEDTLEREVFEEVGLKVKNIKYFGNQPWSLSDSLLMGFFAELDGSNKIKLDKNELSEAKWISRENLPENNSNISLTNTMIEAFRNNSY